MNKLIDFIKGVNLAGVKWIVRLQVALLVVLLLSLFDFLIGSFIQTKPGNLN